MPFFLSVEWFVGFCERQDFAQFDLLGTPFEAQGCFRAQDAKALCEHLAQVCFEVFAQSTILGKCVGLLTYIDEVGRVEDYVGEPVVRVWHLAGIGQHVWLYDKDAAVTEGLHATAAVLEDGERRFFVEPEHAGAAAGIEYRGYHKFRVGVLVEMQDSAPLFGAVEDDFFQAGGAGAYPLFLLVFRNALQVVNVLEQNRGWVKVADKVGKLFDAFRMNPPVCISKLFVQISVLVERGY